MRSVRVEHNGRPAVLETMVDITGRKQLEDTLRTLALVDDLTGLYNRRGLPGGALPVEWHHRVGDDL